MRETVGMFWKSSSIPSPLPIKVKTNTINANSSQAVQRGLNNSEKASRRRGTAEKIPSAKTSKPATQNAMDIGMVRTRKFPNHVERITPMPNPTKPRSCDSRLNQCVTSSQPPIPHKRNNRKSANMFSSLMRYIVSFSRWIGCNHANQARYILIHVTTDKFRSNMG